MTITEKLQNIEKLKKKKEKQPQSLTIPWPTAYILGPLNEELHVKP